MKIHSENFRVRRGEKLKLNEWPTKVKLFFKSKKQHQKLLAEHVEEIYGLYSGERYQSRLDGFAPGDGANPPQASVKEGSLLTGLTSEEARRRLEKFGPNAVPDTAMHPLRRALTKFWAPVPWMLERAGPQHWCLGCSNGR